MRILFIIVIILSFSGILLAQGLTTASINGIVKDNNGNPLVGANVVARHLPSGTVFGAATREDGRFNISNVRVGGPYDITASYIGYKEQEIDSVYLALGENRGLTFILVEAALEIAAIEVVGIENPLLSASRTGASTNVSTEQIERFPTMRLRS